MAGLVPAPCWEGVGSNRGSLPLHLLSKDEGTVRVLVPLPANEALWIAWNLEPGLRVTGRTRDNASVRIVPLTNSMTDWSLYSADAVQGRGGAGTTDANSFQPIDTEAQLEIDHLAFEVLDEGGATENGWLSSLGHHRFMRILLDWPPRFLQHPPMPMEVGDFHDLPARWLRILAVTI